jgi:signal transduction histidine kinase
MTASGQHLLKLINDVLDMSKLEGRSHRAPPSRVRSPALISDTTNMFRLRTQEKQLFLACHLDNSIPRYARTDDGKLRQILINLIGNAVKFTQQGSVNVRAAATPLACGTKARLRVEVEDTGPGISTEEARLLFQAFSQTSAGVKTQGGTGLGLAISREFARLMGGDISVQSIPGLGATFILEIVVECPAPTASRPPPRLCDVRNSYTSRNTCEAS